MTKLLLKALAERDAAEEKVASALKKEYPVDAPIYWERNGIHEGIVMQNTNHDRIKVRNRNTGKELWIYATAVRV